MAGSISECMSFDNELFRVFATYSALIALKMMALSAYTVYLRLTSNTFTNAEDIQDKNIPPDKVQEVLLKRNESIERVRRCHQNDLENIVPFLIVGLLYIASNPPPRFAVFHFRTFAAFRFGHTISYLTPLPQPARFIAFLAGYITTLSMILQILFQGSF